MPRTINKYRCYCLTENTIVFVWNDAPPQFCPNNAQHNLDGNSVAIVETVSDKTMQISQDRGQTGGNFRSETVRAICKPNMTQTFDFSWPFNISVHTLHFVTNAQHIHDKLSCIISPNTIIGYITANVNEDDTIINVSPTVLENCEVGYILSLYDGAKKCCLGYVIQKNYLSGTITCQKPASSTFSAMSPTYVLLEIRNINDFEIGEPNKYDIGTSLIQGGFIPANTIVRMEYQNKSKTDAKLFVAYFEYFY
jgi:hypothetical protein